MNGVLVDSCVLLDLFTNDLNWGDWSESILEQYSQKNTMYINSIAYTEVSMGFKNIEDVESAISNLGIKVLEIPREALFLAGKIYIEYRKNRGTKHSPLPDFFVGAHALVSNFDLITRDLGKYSTYFPKLKLIHPGH